MLSVLKQPYVFALVSAVLTAALAALIAGYTRPADADRSKVFYKTLLAASVVSLGLAYFVNRVEPVSTEPFIDPAQMANIALPEMT